MRRTVLCVLLAALQAFNTGCIHTRAEETHAVDVSHEGDFNSFQDGPVQGKYVVYRESELPLGEFFSRLKKGEYKEAFRRVDLNYRSSNTSNEALQELLEAGFVPVYAEIRNTGTTEISFDEKSFLLGDPAKGVKAYYAEQLPRQFRHFSPKAAAANVYNTGIVVVSFFGLMVAASILLQGKQPGPWMGPDLGGASPIYNDTEKTTRVDYRQYLLSKTTLKPGETRRGLLFFYDIKGRPERDVKLAFVH